MSQRTAPPPTPPHDGRRFASGMVWSFGQHGFRFRRDTDRGQGYNRSSQQVFRTNRISSQLSMKPSTFDSIVKLIDAAPAEAIHGAARLHAGAIERKMKRGKALDEEGSRIMAFCEFLDNPALPKNLSALEKEFYRRTVARLVAARKMPPGIMNQFD